MYSHQSLPEERLLDSCCLGRKGPIKKSLSAPPSVHPFVCPSAFLRLAHYIFLKLSMMLGAHIWLCVTAGFFGKNPPRGKMVKNGLKIWVLDFLRKWRHYFFSGICVKWKFLWFINILWKLYAWEKSSSQVIDKNGSRPMRF